MRPSNTPDEDTLRLWYELGSLYSRTAGDRSRAVRLGFTVTLVAGALILLSAPMLGTAWAGPFAAILPVAAGIISGGGWLAWKRLRLLWRAATVSGSLKKRGLDAERPARDGLAAYYDPQLVLLRSEYEYLRVRGFLKTARLFEEAFGFTPEDSFETGPLNIAPETGEMRRLRERWERRIPMRREHGMEAPAMGAREDRAYRVFPREMTVPAELSVRREYLEISRSLLIIRYGRDVLTGAAPLPEKLKRRVERDLGEHAAITRRSGG